MPRITHAMKDAQLAAKDSKIYQLTVELRDAKRVMQELRDQLAVAGQALAEPKTRRELMDRCKALNAAGVPCKLRDNHLIHAFTGALLE